MSRALENICVSVAAVEFLVGILVNGFIGLMNFMDWVKTKRLSTMSFILTGLAISRIYLLCTTLAEFSMIVFCPELHILTRLKRLGVFWFVSNSMSTWFATFLSIFYLLKIANFSHPIFLWMKWRISKVVFRILVGFLIIHLLICVIVVEKINHTKTIYFDLENRTNMTQDVQLIKTQKFAYFLLFNMGGLVPFILSLVSCFLLLLSLSRHTQQLKLNVTGLRDLSTEAHVKAMKSVVSFLFLFVMDYLALLTGVLSQLLFLNRIAVIFAVMLMASYPSSHSIILILGNSKLRKSSMMILGKLKGCLEYFGKFLRLWPENCIM